MNSIMNRRAFLKKSATVAAGTALGPYFLRPAHAASRDRVTIFHSSVADSNHPFNHSSSPIYGNWQHVIEPLVEYDVGRKDFIGVLADALAAQALRTEDGSRLAAEKFGRAFALWGELKDDYWRLLAAQLLSGEYARRKDAEGAARLRVRTAVPRCAITGFNPASGARDQDVMKGLIRYRDKVGLPDGMLPGYATPGFATYAEVLEPGKVSLGDPVVLL